MIFWNSVTKVQLPYALRRSITDKDARGISDVHGAYGIQRVKLGSGMDAITVEYDASRLKEQDVEATLIRYGIPIERRWNID